MTRKASFSSVTGASPKTRTASSVTGASPKTYSSSSAINSDKEKIRNRILAVKAPDKKGNNLVKSSMAGSAAGIAQAGRVARNRLRVSR